VAARLYSEHDERRQSGRQFGDQTEMVGREAHCGNLHPELWKHL
jgi:hypothetical protein